MDLSQLTVSAGLQDAIMALIIALLGMGVNYVKNHFTVKQMEGAKKTAKVVVFAVEQYAQGKAISGPDKLSEAILRAKGLAKKAGVRLTDDQWDSFIHGALAELKRVWDR